TLRSERIFTVGDCSSSTTKACFRASLKTRSPVVLMKSASTTVTASCFFLVLPERCERIAIKPAPITSTTHAATRNQCERHGGDVPSITMRDCSRAAMTTSVVGISGRTLGSDCGGSDGATGGG